MNIEYIVKCKYYGKDKIYYKVFNTSKEHINFKNWITTKRGYTNIRFLRKKIEDTDCRIIGIKKNKQKEDKRHYILSKINTNRKPIKFNKFIYCLLYNNKVVYVGMTSNIQSRILTHKSEGVKTFDEFSIIEKYPYEAEDSILLSKEKYYIKLLKPKYNKTHS